MSAFDSLRLITGEDFQREVTPDRARRLIEQALLDGFDPSDDPARAHIPAGQGHLLLMPSVLGQSVGVKIASVAPGNPQRGLPRIQALYLLVDADTLTPTALLDGSALTAVRTPATTAVACDRLAAGSASRLVVFGSGPQAVEHVIALVQIRELTDIRLVGRTPERTRPALEELASRGIRADQGSSEDLAQADIIVCATSSSEPLFDTSLVRDGACVAAIGAHQPDHRELEAALMARSLVVVEDTDTALREAGDVVLAIGEGALQQSQLHTLRSLVLGETVRAEDRPNVFKGTGMSWQDAAVASGVDLSS